jgi:REP element-mobilizing transposase RayT
MPRTARIDHPDLLQHVIVRGVNRCDIFLDDVDRHKFLQRFSSLLVETQTECLAWALLDNHFHLLLRPRNSGLAHFMRRLLTAHAIRFNRRHGRSGHLFQNRYKSIVCDEDAYLLELVRYIHLNPLRAGLVNGLEELAEYPWAGHGVLMGRTALAGQAVDEVLRLFAENSQEGRRRYYEFIADGLKMGRRNELVGGRRTDSSKEANSDDIADVRILGGSAFVQELCSRQKFSPRLGGRIEIGEIVQRVCSYYDADPVEIGKNIRTKRVSMLRSVICCLAVREAGHSGVQVGRQVNLGRAGVSHAAARGAETLRINPVLLKLLDE